MSAEVLSGQELEDFLAFQKTKEQTTDEGIIINDPEASGRIDAFLAGMSNNEDYKTRWLAEKRFPDLVEQGVDPMQFYFVDGDGDLSYKDPKDGFKAKKEFKEGLLGQDVDYFDNIGPTGQFLAEVIPGVIGLGAGFTVGGLPGASVGGAGGTGLGGAIAYGIRGGISQFFGGPPMDVQQATKDLAFSSAFGGLPIGVPSSAVPKAFKGVYERFPGIEGREALQDIVLNGGQTVDDKIAYLSSKYPDVTITRAEADALVGSRGAQLQAWLLKQPENEKLVNFYNNRNERVRDIAENFFDEILSGKYVDSALKNKLTGKAAIDAEVDVARALDDFLINEKKKLQTRVGPIYQQAYDLDVAVDVSDILENVLKVIDDPNVSAAKKNAYLKIQKALTDANTDSARNTTELLHQGLKDDFNRVFASLSTGNNADAILKREITQIRNQVQNRIREVNPSYKKATDIYNEATGTAQQLEKSIAGQFAKVVDLGGQRAAALSKKMFSGNIPPKEVEELKRILQETPEGATAWQNLKGTWLSTQWEDVIVSQTNPLSEPNAYLRALGIKSPGKAFPAQKLKYDALGNPLPATADEMAKLSQDVAEAQVKGKKARMWEAIFEPDELDAFMDLTDMLQAVGRLQTAAGSDTFANLAIDEIITAGSKQVIGSGAPGAAVVGKTLGVVDTVTGLPSRVLFKGTDLAGKANAAQKDAYIDLLIAHIVDPSKRVIMQEGLQAFKPNVYLAAQTFARGGVEGVKELADTITKQNEAIQQELQQPTSGAFEQPEQVEQPQVDPNLQTSLDQFSMPRLEQPAFDMPASDLAPPQMLSPTILPDERDREIAMRQMGGLGSLA
jgi:hypothetical protein|tara:strand:+ start:1194 stop:3725 length:2532 start_codon:yes stop_codon:yes gene_type:complete